MESIGQIDGKYNIIRKFDSGNQGKIYLVTDDKGNELIAKIPKNDEDKNFGNEIKIYKEVFSGKNTSHIIKYIDSGKCEKFDEDKNGEGNEEENEDIVTINYLILEYCPERNLINYIINCGNCGFNINNDEELTKLLFKKIVKCVEECHKNGICHRDIKLQNILLDANFCPKICDFGYSTRNGNQLKDKVGTQSYLPPEILEGKPYDGFKADIFSLGASFILLATGKRGFSLAYKKDGFYQYIYNNKIDNYWDNISKYEIQGLSDNFKSLYIKMISYLPKDRPTIEEILSHPWFDSINNMNPEELQNLEGRLRAEFERRKEIIKKNIAPEIERNTDKREKLIKKDNRGGNFETNDDELYTQNMEPEIAKDYIDMKYKLTIKGNLEDFKPYQFMNEYIFEIKNDLDEKVTIIPDEQKLSFFVSFNFDFINNNELEDDDNYLIKVKMYKKNDQYIIRFQKKRGDEFYINEAIQKLYSIAKNLL